VADWAGLREFMDKVANARRRHELTPLWQQGHVPEPLWAPEYVWALEQAIERGDKRDLIAMLNQRMAIHPVLLPGLALLLGGRRPGTPKGLLEPQEAALREMYTHHVGPGKMKPEAFCEQWADWLHVSKSTIERAVGIRKKR
jgi:hypothetical protein